MCVKAGARPAARFDQLTHDFCQYDSRGETRWGQFIIGKTDEKIRPTEYRIVDADHSQGVAIEMRNRCSRLQSGAEAVAHGAHQQGQTVDFSDHIDIKRMLLANRLQPAAQPMPQAWHNQRDSGELVRRDAIVGKGSQYLMGANQKQTLFKIGLELQRTSFSFWNTIAKSS